MRGKPEAVRCDSMSYLRDEFAYSQAMDDLGDDHEEEGYDLGDDDKDLEEEEELDEEN